MHSLPVLTPDQAAEWDRRAADAGVATATLMETAGRAVVQVLVARWTDRVRQGVLVACGPGHNGGDGWVAARVLHRHGIPVWVAALPGAAPGSLGEAMAAQARAAGVREVAPDGPWPAAGVVVDAILGTGARGAPHGAASALVERLADLHLPVVAVDGPTGLDLRDGVQHGPLRADLTVTFGGYRRGHLLARDDVGDVVVVEIGFPVADPSWPTLYTDEQARSALPPFRAGLHKGDRGRLVVVGGSAGMTGAARLAARAGFAAGAGLVHVMAPASSITVLAAAEPDLQTCVQPLDEPPGEAAVALLERAEAVVVGPGLGTGTRRRELVVAVLQHARTAVVDADALSVFGGAVEQLAEVCARVPLVLTPHLGEFRRLFPDLATDAAVDPWHAAAAAAERTGATILLKGVPTVVARRDGAPVTIAAGNPGLATGGSGDTLSGFIAAFLGQGLDAPDAAALGAQVLGRTADLAARRSTARAVRPMDVVAAAADLWRVWDLARLAPPLLRPPVLHELERPQHA